MSDIQASFTTKRFVLLGLLEKAASVVPSKDILPVLKNFQLVVDTDRLRVIASDLELSVLAQTDLVTVDQPGTVVFPARKTLDILREAGEGEVHVLVRDYQAEIMVGQATWTLRLQTGEDYPALPTTLGELHEIDPHQFLAALRQVRYAAAKDTNRPQLMMIDVTDGKMTACDGVRFQQTALADFPLSLQIPTAAIDELVKLLKAAKTAVRVGESDSHLIFVVGNDVFLVNKLMAAFPDVERLLLRPALENDQLLQVDCAELIDAVKRVRINADAETQAIGLDLSDDQVVVTSKDKYNNGATEALSAYWAGNARMLVVNHQFLLEMLNMYPAKNCQFYLSEDAPNRKSPLLLRDEETESATVGVIQQMHADLVGYER